MDDSKEKLNYDCDWKKIKKKLVFYETNLFLQGKKLEKYEGASKLFKQNKNIKNKFWFKFELSFVVIFAKYKIEFYCTIFQRYLTKFDFSFITSFLMQTFNKHDIMEAQTTREKKKALKFLKEAFET